MNGGLFGTAGSQPQKRTASEGFSFGQPSATPAFGSQSQTQPQSGGLFGSQSQPQSGGLFGSQSQTQPQSGGLFGSQTQTQPQSGGLFGSQTQTQPQSGGLFGSQTQPQSGGLFGSQSQSKPQTGGLFGSQSQTQPQSGGLFGSQSQTQPQSGGLFGQSQTQPQSGGLFGQSQTQPQSGGLFGQSQTQPQSGGLFGQSQTQPQSGGLFGQSQTQPQSGGLFSQTQQQSGASQPRLLGLFGQQNSIPQTNGTQAQSGTTIFGQSGQNAAGPLAQSGFANPANQYNQNQNQLFNQTPLIATIDQAFYPMPEKGKEPVEPPTKLYSSLIPASEKKVQTERVIPTLNASEKPAEAPVEPLSLHLSEKEHRFANSYERFVTERPLDLVVRRTKVPRLEKAVDPVSRAKDQAQITAKDKEPNENGSKSKDEGENEPKKAKLDVSPVQSLSAFYNPSKSLTIVRVSRKALEQGYFLSPSLEELAAYSKAELGKVENLVIGRRGFGQLSYDEPVDLSTIANLGEILGSLVVFEQGTVCVYPDEASKPPLGEELNLPCTVSIENAFPVDSTGTQITEMSDARIAKHIERLRKASEAQGSTFVTFCNGVWVFKVPHFSVWGLAPSEMVIDSEEDMEEQDDSPETSDNESVATENDIGVEESEPPKSWLAILQTESKDALSNAPLQINSAKDLDDLLFGETSTNLETTNDQVISELHNRQEFSSSARQNGLPKLESQADLNCLLEVLPQGKALASILFDNSLSPVDKRQRLGDWLVEQSKDYATEYLNKDPSPQNTVWGYLLERNVQDAARVAINESLEDVALLISSLGKTECIRDTKLHLANDSKPQKCPPLLTRKILYLASSKMGGTLVSTYADKRSETEDPCTGLPWQNALGLRVWYGDEPLESCIGSICGDSSLEWNLLALFENQKSLDSIERLQLSDEHLFLLLQTIPNTNNEFDSICGRLANAQLEKGALSEALFVALHTRSDKRALALVRKLLHKAPNLANEALYQKWQVPSSLVLEAQAELASQQGDYESETRLLIQAGRFQQANRLIASSVGPSFVIEDKVEGLKEIVGLIPQNTEGYQDTSIYKDYCSLLSGPPSQSLEKRLQSVLSSLETPTLLMQAAVSIMAKNVALKSRYLDIDAVMRMKFNSGDRYEVALAKSFSLLNQAS